MAVIDDLMQNYDQSDTNDYSIAEGVHMISPTETPLQLILPKIQVSAVKDEWIEDELQSQVSSLLGTVADTDTTTITVASGDGADKFPSDVATYNTVIRIDQEYMLVTAVSTDDLTVTRGYASTTAATHAVSAVVHIVSVLEHEGADGKTARARGRSRPSNFVQTFSRTVEVSGVQEAIKKLGGITSEVDYQIMQAMRQLGLELEKTIVMGVADQVGDGSSTFRTMGGLWHMIATNRTSDSGAVDTTAIEADIRTLWDAGGNPRAIVGDGKMVQDIGNLYSDRIRTDIQTTVGGINITSIVNPLGVGPIALIPHRHVAAGEYYMLDTSKIGLTFIRAFGMKPLAEDGDAQKRWIGGDYSIQLMNEQAHAYRYGLN